MIRFLGERGGQRDRLRSASYKSHDQLGFQIGPIKKIELIASAPEWLDVQIVSKIDELLANIGKLFSRVAAGGSGHRSEPCRDLPRLDHLRSQVPIEVGKGPLTGRWQEAGHGVEAR